MPLIVSLLRAVNVGGRNLVRMEALRSLYSSLGFEDVQSYVQSGNVIFRTESKDLPAIADSIRKAIARKFSVDSDIILRTSGELRKVMAANPFKGTKGLDPRKLQVAFLPADPGAAARKKVLEIKVTPEELRAQGRELFIYFPEGMGRSRFPWPLVEKTLGMRGTVRNWNTVTKLLEMTEQIEAG